MDDTHLITLLSGFCFDFTHMFAPGGLKDEELDALFPQLQAAEEGLSYIRREGRAYHHLSKDGVPGGSLFYSSSLYRRRLSQHAAAHGAAGSFWQESIPRV